MARVPIFLLLRHFCEGAKMTGPRAIDLCPSF